jgi:hypothetical protein
VLGKTQAFGYKAVKRWCFDFTVVKDAKIAVSHVVCENHYNIGFGHLISLLLLIFDAPMSSA